jgi:ribonuclease HI
MMSADIVEIFTDGACRGNPGPGGWGALLRFKGREREISGAERLTTNNRMELLAAIEALASLSRTCKVELTTDSKYVCDGIQRWLPKWRTNNWRTANRTPVKNADLWQRLDELASRHEVRWLWTRGHSGHVENERADRLATTAIDTLGGRDE